MKSCFLSLLQMYDERRLQKKKKKKIIFIILLHEACICIYTFMIKAGLIVNE